jgi:hypothetical protein
MKIKHVAFLQPTKSHKQKNHNSSNNYDREEDFHDNVWYKENITRYNKLRDIDLKECPHVVWSKHCGKCKRVVSSEMTDADYLDYLQLQKDFNRLENILIRWMN